MWKNGVFIEVKEEKKKKKVGESVWFEDKCHQFYTIILFASKALYKEISFSPIYCMVF